MLKVYDARVNGNGVQSGWHSKTSNYLFKEGHVTSIRTHPKGIFEEVDDSGRGKEVQPDYRTFTPLSIDLEIKRNAKI